MIVATFYLMRLDNFRRPDETVEQHTERMTKAFDAQDEQIKVGGINSIVEKRAEFPPWLVDLIKSLPGELKMSLWARFKNFIRRMFGLRQKGHELAVYDVDNREWKVFFSGKGEAVAALGWRTLNEPDAPGHFQHEFEKAIAADPEKAKWAATNRLQIGNLTEISNDVLGYDEDMADVFRATN